jgi:hypothetical protein
VTITGSGFKRGKNLKVRGLRSRGVQTYTKGNPIGRLKCIKKVLLAPSSNPHYP